VLRSVPENIIWGWFPTDARPVLTVRSGQTVRIDTLSHAGSTQDAEPAAFLAPDGIRPDEIPQDVLAFRATRNGRPREGRGAHLLTGPIAIADAEPGDTLEVQVLALTPRAPFGINTTTAQGGVFSREYPGTKDSDPLLAIAPGTRHVIRTATVGGRQVALFSDAIHVPLQPFMGIMAVAPATPMVGQPGVTMPGVQSSRPPGPYGGNMDFKSLTTGSTLYLPVFQRGALFYVGDPHSAQGDGEVSGTAIEQSLTGVFRFVLHKGRKLETPRAEDAAYYYVMGIDVDLDRAMRLAVNEAVKFLVEDKKLTPAKALSLSSIAVDFHVAEAVDLTQLVVGKIPKRIFVR
jgi:acetamidase/formamidase